MIISNGQDLVVLCYWVSICQELTIPKVSTLKFPLASLLWNVLTVIVYFYFFCLFIYFVEIQYNHKLHIFLGTSEGFYMHALGSTTQANETARLLSVIFKPTNASRGQCKMRFYYHIHGSKPSTLSVRMRTNAATATGKLLWSKSGTTSAFVIFNEKSLWRDRKIVLSSLSQRI